MGVLLVTGAGDSSTDTIQRPAATSLTPQRALRVCVFLGLGNAPVNTSSLCLKSGSWGCQGLGADGEAGWGLTANGQRVPS